MGSKERLETRCVYTWGTPSAVFRRRHTLTESLVEKDETLWACFSELNERKLCTATEND